MSKKIGGGIDEIKAAVGASNRMASFSPASALKAKFLSLDAERAHHKRAEELRSTQEGIAYANLAAEKLMGKLEQLLAELQTSMTQLKLRIARKTHSIEVKAPYRINLSAAFHTHYTNSLINSALSLIIYEPQDPFERDPEYQPSRLVRTDYEPDFAPDDQVIWKVRDGRQFTTEQLAAEILSALHDELTKAQARDQQRRD